MVLRHREKKGNNKIMLGGLYITLRDLWANTCSVIISLLLLSR